MNRLSLLTLVFAIASLVFFLLLIFLRIPFPPYALMSWQDALDLLTPMVLIPIYWLMFRRAGGRAASRAEELVFIAFAGIWVLGHGMHLSANSINNLAEGLAERGGTDILATDIYRLTYFYDEYLSHYLWHAGILGLAALLIYQEWRDPAGLRTTWSVVAVGGFLYGVTWFLVFLEGQTAALGLPFVVLVTLLVLVWGRRKLADHPLLAFFFIACLLASALFAGWALYWGGLPELSEVGLI